MQDQIEKFKTITLQNFSRKDFIYHEWLGDYHLKIVERIALELCGIYSGADKDLVQTLVWFHDFGKPLDTENEKSVTLIEAPKTMKECGFSDDFIEKVIQYWKISEQKNEIDLRTAPIEVQIISSADGASHFVGMFYADYFRDDLKESIASIQERLREKIEKDWNRKIVLPEVKKDFEDRYKKALELVGEFPERFITKK